MPALLPRSRKAWAAWNACVPRDPGCACTVSYCMNLLQGIESPRAAGGHAQPQRGHRSAPRCCARMHYHHPVYTQRVGRRADAQGRDPGPAPHLVRRRLLGLGLSRGRHAQRGGSVLPRSACTGRGPIRAGMRGGWRRDAPQPTALASAVYEGMRAPSPPRAARARVRLPHGAAVSGSGRARSGVRGPLAVVRDAAQSRRVPPQRLSRARPSCRWPMRCASCVEHGHRRAADRAGPPADPPALLRATCSIR